MSELGSSLVPEDHDVIDRVRLGGRARAGSVLLGERYRSARTYAIPRVGRVPRLSLNAAQKLIATPALAAAILRLDGVACHRAPPRLVMPRSPTDTGCTPQWISTRLHAHRALSSGKSIVMPASIVLSGLAWSTPDGRPLFSNSISASAPSAPASSAATASARPRCSSSIAGDAARRTPARSAVSGTLGVLRQTVQRPPGETVADLFGATRRPGPAAARRAAATASAEELAVADWTLEARIAAALAGVGLDAPPDTPLATLSGGQRTRVGAGRAGLRRARFPPARRADQQSRPRRPRVGDRPARRLARRRDRGQPRPRAARDHGRDRRAHLARRHALRRQLEPLSRAQGGRAGGGAARSRRCREAGRRRRPRAPRRTPSARRARTARASASAREGDIPRILLGTMKDRSEATGGEAARLAERRRAQALDEAAAARERIEVLQPLSVVLPSTGLPAGKTVLRLEAASVGLTNRPADPARSLVRRSSGPRGSPSPGQRLGQDDAAGAGHRHAAAVAAARCGSMVPFALLDQQVEPARSGALDPRQFPAAQSRTPTRTPAAPRSPASCSAPMPPCRRVSSLSGGQLLRAGLACVLGGADAAAAADPRRADQPSRHRLDRGGRSRPARL